MTAMAAVAMLVGVGGNALAAIKLGERKKRVAERVLGNSFVLLLGVDALIAWAVGALALDPILRFSGADDAVLPARARLHDGHHRGLPLAVRGVRHEQLHPHGGASQPRARLHARGHGLRTSCSATCSSSCSTAA